MLSFARVARSHFATYREMKCALGHTRVAMERTLGIRTHTSALPRTAEPGLKSMRSGNVKSPTLHSSGLPSAAAELKRWGAHRSHIVLGGRVGYVDVGVRFRERRRCSA
jgi:hypothetical protein